MPTLKERIDDIFRATGQIVFEDWFDNLREVSSLLAFYGAVTYEGYVQNNLIPIVDGEFVIGLPQKRIKDVYSDLFDAAYGIYSPFANIKEIQAEDIETDTIIARIIKSDTIESDYVDVSDAVTTKTINAETANVDRINGDWGYFEDNVYVQGKRVIKDEDPLYIASFFYEAKEQIKDIIIEALDELNIEPNVKVIGKAIGYNAPAFADILPNDAIVEFDGIVRIKAITEYDVLAYLKWTPYGEIYPIISLLNDGNPLKANVLNELSTYASKNDKVNVRVIPSSKVTIFVYNTNI